MCACNMIPSERARWARLVREAEEQRRKHQERFIAAHLHLGAYGIGHVGYEVDGDTTSSYTSDKTIKI